MLIAAKQICSCAIEGADGTVGKVKDLLFDDQTWDVRYLEVDTGRWLPGRRVILAPSIIHTANYEAQRLSSPLMREQVENSPPIESELPVSRQKEIELAQYYAWGAYWANTEAVRRESEGPPHLRSTNHVTGYHIRATDGEIGHVADFIVDDHAVELEGWAIRYLVIDTRNWLPGKHVLVPPLWTESIDWDSRRLQVGLTRQMVEQSPAFDPEVPVNRRYEEVFYDYYGRPQYWTAAERPV